MKYENYALIQENWNKFTVEVTEDKMELEEGRAAKLAVRALDGAVGLGVALDLAGFSDMVLTYETAPALIGYALYRLVQAQSKKTGKSPKEIVVNHLDAIDNNPKANSALRQVVRQLSVVIDPQSDEEVSDPKELVSNVEKVLQKTRDEIARRKEDPSLKGVDPSQETEPITRVPVKIKE